MAPYAAYPGVARPSEPAPWEERGGEKEKRGERRKFFQKRTKNGKNRRPHLDEENVPRGTSSSSSSSSPRLLPLLLHRVHDRARAEHRPEHIRRHDARQGPRVRIGEVAKSAALAGVVVEAVDFYFLPLSFEGAQGGGDEAGDGGRVGDVAGDRGYRRRAAAVARKRGRRKRRGRRRGRGFFLFYFLLFVFVATTTTANKPQIRPRLLAQLPSTFHQPLPVPGGDDDGIPREQMLPRHRFPQPPASSRDDD